MNKKKIILIIIYSVVIIGISGVVGYFIAKNNKSQVLSNSDLKNQSSTQENSVKPTTQQIPANEVQNSQPNASQNTPTTTETNKKPKTSSTPVSIQPQCNAGAKNTAINNENYQYQQLVQAENNYFYQINYNYSHTDCRNMAGDCPAIFDAYVANPKRHATKLQELEAQHSANLAKINGTCY